MRDFTRTKFVEVEIWIAELPKAHPSAKIFLPFFYFLRKENKFQIGIQSN